MRQFFANWGLFAASGCCKEDLQAVHERVNLLSKA
jgi:hypothetical protein